MKRSASKTALIDIDRASEFVGDIVDQYSQIVDLGENYEFLTVQLPTIDSASITPYVQEEQKITKALDASGPAVVGTIPVPVHFFHDNNADTDVIQSTVASTGLISITFRIGGYQYIRLLAGATQTADGSVKCWGFNRTP